jgi:hypothetical protein
MAVFVLAFAVVRLREGESNPTEEAPNSRPFGTLRELFGGRDETASQLRELQDTVDALKTQQTESARLDEARAREQETAEAEQRTADDLQGTAAAIQRQLTSEANITSAQETVSALQALADSQATENALVAQAQMTEIARLQTEATARAAVVGGIIRATAISDMPTGVVVGPVAEASASSNQQVASRAVDSYTHSAWLSGSLDLAGSWLEFAFRVDKVVNGIRVFQTSNQQYARPEHITLMFSDGTTQRISLRDEPGWQYIKLDPVTTISCRLIIESVYRRIVNDNEASNVAIYEVELYGPR